MRLWRNARLIGNLGLVFLLVGITAKASAEESPSSPTLAEQCASEILAPPRIEHAQMGQLDTEHQYLFVMVGFGAINEACDGHYKRLASQMPQLVRHGHIINMDPAWEDLLKEGDTNDATPPGSSPGFLWFNSHHNPKLYYHKGDKARFRLRLQVLDLASKRIVRTVETTHKVTIKR